jgi:alpha-galactosidase
MQGYRVAQEGPLEVWVKPLTGGRKAVGLFNRELGTMAVTVYFRDIRVGADARLRDLWARKDLGRFHEKYTANVAGHGVVMVQVTSEE